MSGHKWTQGEWSVSMEEKWPFRIEIAPNIVCMDRVAYSTGQKSLDEVRRGVGFRPAERDDIVRLIAEQEASAHLIAAAPDLYEALEAALAWIDAVPSDAPLPTMPGFDRDAVEDAMAKARGETP